MRMILRAAAVALAGLSVPAAAQSAPNAGAETLPHCMALKTTGADRLVLARWIAGALASSPQVADMVKINPATKDAADREFGALVTRLLSVDCFDVASRLAKSHDLSEALKAGFQTLGELAMGELTSDPAANAEMGKFAKYIDEEKLKKLGQ